MILKKLQDTVRKYALFAAGDRILIAYSGGVDSTGLLVLLRELQKEWSLDLGLGHFNHKIRPDADKDEEFVRKMAEKKSLRLYVGSEDVRTYAEANKLNLEEAGRILRYRFLQRTAAEAGYALVATGHTMTDQAETFLMRLFRGSGLSGLAGIHPYRADKVIRPLLFIERGEIESYLKEKGETCCQDESNRDLSYVRNRIRNELIPFIRENYDPQIIRRISRLASLVMEEDALLAALTHDVSGGVFVPKNGRLSLDAKALSRLPLALQRRLVRNYLFQIKKTLRDISYDDIESILMLSEGKAFHLHDNLILKREQGLIARHAGLSVIQPYEFRWDGIKDLEIPELCMTFTGEKRARSADLSQFFNDRLSVCLDWGKLQLPIKVRNRSEGDRYQPLGAPGRKKLKEIMRSKGIPPSERGAHPVFLSGEDIVWVLGLPVSERYKITKNTREVLIVSLKVG